MTQIFQLLLLIVKCGHDTNTESLWLVVDHTKANQASIEILRRTEEKGGGTDPQAS